MTTYTLFGQPPNPSSLTADTADYTMGVQFTVSQAATLDAIWFWSAPGAGALPDTIALYAVTGQALVQSEAATWSGAAGSGWVRAAFTSPPALTAATAYKACIFENTGNFFYAGTAHFWDTGPGASGIVNGPLSAPNTAGADGGQDTFTQGALLAYPATSFNAGNYWVDPEVTVSGGVAHTATASLTVTPAVSAGRTLGHSRTAGLTVTPSVAASRTRGKYRTAGLTVRPSASAARVAGRNRTAGLTVAPSVTAARTAGRYRHAALAVTPRITATSSGGTSAPVMFALGSARYRWSLGRARNGEVSGMVLSQSAVSTQYVQVQVQASLLGAPYDPTGDAVQMAFVPASYIPQNPSPSQWQAATWETDPGPVYWAQCLVGPVNGGLVLAAGSYTVWVKVADSPEVPALSGPNLLIT